MSAIQKNCYEKLGLSVDLAKEFLENEELFKNI